MRPLFGFLSAVFVLYLNKTEDHWAFARNAPILMPPLTRNLEDNLQYRRYKWRFHRD